MPSYFKLILFAGLYFLIEKIVYCGCDLFLFGGHNMLIYCKSNISRTPLEEIDLPISAGIRASALLMPYDEVKLIRDLRDQRKNVQMSYSESDHESKPDVSKRASTYQSMRTPDPKLEFSLTVKVCHIANNSFAQALDQSDFSRARNIIKELRELSKLSSDGANTLLLLINRHEKDEF